MGQPRPSPQIAERLMERLLGPQLAARLAGGVLQSQELYLATAQLASARYAIGTYLPRRLLHRRLASADDGPWLEWVAGSLLFADVSGSTALAEQLSARGREGSEIVTDTLNRYFGTMIARIEAAGGDLLTFGGDALLVLFSDPDHTLTATATALGLLEELADFRREVPGVGTFPLSMHIGVERGHVALVSAGQPGSLRYSAMGETVNVVACAEGYGGPGELVLGPRAWAAVASQAQGDEVAPGFVRLRALRDAPRPRPAEPEPPPALIDVERLQILGHEIGRLSPYLPAALLDRILADPARPQIEADLRPVTVLFAQVLGLGELVGALPPHRAAAVVDAFLQPIQAAVQQYGGFINKLDLADEGEKILAVFGAPVAYEDHAERAAHAALLLLEEVARLEADGQALGASLRLRIGLNTGTVFAGNVGSAERKEYTVMGDAVNVAARVMASAAWGEARCAPETAGLIGGAIVLGDPQVVRLKGKAEPLELLRLERERAAPAPAAADLPLVGRDRELRRLRLHLEAAARGRGRTVRVGGEAGLGKTRLAAALAAEAVGAGRRVLAVRCLAYNSAAPYRPWAELLRTLCGIVKADDGPARAGRLAAAMERAGIAAADWLPLLADLIQIEAPDSSLVRGLDPQQRQARRFDLILDLLRSAAPAQGQPPLVVIFDNLHWADQVSLDLWQHVAGHIGDAAILLIGLHRGALGWGSGPQGDGADLVELLPLDEADSMALLAQLPGADGVEPALREQVVARAGGNPLFIEELLRAVSEGRASLDALPDSLSGLLLARIDRLDERERSLLRVAAVIGQRFPVGVLSSLQERDQEALLRQLARLDAAELTSPEPGGRAEQAHLFRHALLHEVAYQSLLFARRRELHRRIGEHLEQRYAADLAEIRAQYGADQPRAGLIQIGRNGSLLSRTARASGAPIFLLAHHYRLSDAPAQAVPYLLLAGHIARDDYANDQAMQYYRWTLEALEERPADPRSWEAREALGDVLCTLGRYDEAIGEYRTIIEAGPPAAQLPPAVVAEVLRSWGDALEKQGRYQEALERLRRAEQICSTHLAEVSPLLLAAVYADMGQVLRRLGEFDLALAICTTGLSKIRNDHKSAEDERIEADLQQLMATLYAMRGQYDQARFHFENALAAQEAIDDLYGCSRVHNNLGFLAQLQSDYARAVGHYEQAAALAGKISAKYVRSSVLLNLAGAAVLLGNFAESAAAAREAMALCEEMGERDGIAKAHDTLGVVLYGQGDYAAAAASYQAALAIYQELGSGYEAANSQALLAAVHSAQGRPAEARGLAAQALDVARRSQVPQLESLALAALAEADLAAAGAGAPEPAALLTAAADQAAEAAAIAARIGSPQGEGLALRLRGEAEAARGNPFAHHFEAALAIFRATRSAFEEAVALARYGAALAACNEPGAAAYLEAANRTLTRIGARGELRRMGLSDERSP